MATPTLKARPRTETEKGSRACRSLRGQGEVPVNFYRATKGSAPENHNLAVSAYELYKLIERKADILNLDVEGKVELVRVSEVQRDQFGDDVVHVDMRWMDPETPVPATIALEFSGRPQGIKDLSLVSLSARSISISCKPREIPDMIHVDLGTLSAGQNMTTGGVQLPAGATLLGSPDILVASVGKSTGA